MTPRASTSSGTTSGWRTTWTARSTGSRQAARRSRPPWPSERGRSRRRSTEAGGMLWVVSTTDEALYEVDVRKAAARLVRRVPLGVVPAGVTTASKGDAVWVTGASIRRVTAAAPSTFAARIPDRLTRPSAAPRTSSGLLNGSYDGLVGLRHAPGAKGVDIVPDLATTLPAPTDGGRSYTFRPASRHPVVRWKPADRLRRPTWLRAGHPVRPDHRPERDRGRTQLQCRPSATSAASTRPAARTVTIHLLRPNAAFLEQIATFCPAVPASTPLAEQKRRAGAGDRAVPNQHLRGGQVDRPHPEPLLPSMVSCRPTRWVPGWHRRTRSRPAGHRSQPPRRRRRSRMSLRDVTTGPTPASPAQKPSWPPRSVIACT